MVKCGVLFEVRTELLNNIQTSVGFKGLKRLYLLKSFLFLTVGTNVKQTSETLVFFVHICRGNSPRKEALYNEWFDCL
jgi:hypothetical protein